jgi:adenylate cyclase
MLRMLLGWWHKRAQQRRMRSAFGRYLSPAVVQRLSEEPGALRLGGELTEITQLYVEIAEFDLLCADLDPTAVGAFLNAYFDGAVNRILENHGTVDHFLPGGFSAWFGAPRNDPANADHAVQAALALVEDLPGFAAQRPSPKERAMKIHVGLHTDTVLVGTIGGTKRFEYSTAGLAVVVASRLPAIARERAISVLATEGTVMKLSGAYTLREIAPIPVPGKDALMRTYELLGNA